MGKILFFVNNDFTIYNFRLEIVEKFLSLGHEILIVSPYGKRVDLLVELGCKHVPIQINLRGTNPFKELKLLKDFKKILKEEKPNIVFTYTIKPNVYGGIACRKMKIPYVANVTGLGDAVENGGLLQKITLFLYRKGLKGAQKVFFQNEQNMTFFEKKKVVKKNYDLLPGSGVNLKKFNYLAYPKTEQVRFLYIGRIIKDKGVNELSLAIKEITKRYSNVYFDIVGDTYEGSENPFLDIEKCVCHGHQADVKSYIENCSAVILPTYHEGMANVLLESSACGRPVLASNIPGCKETFDEGISGFGFEPKSADAICQAIVKFLALTVEQREEMGKKAREKMEYNFDRNIVVDKYVSELKKDN